MPQHLFVFAIVLSQVFTVEGKLSGIKTAFGKPCLCLQIEDMGTVLITVTTYKDCKNLRTNSGSSVPYLCTWCLTVALSRNGLDESPKTTQVNLNTTTLGFSFNGSSTHNKRNTSLSSSATDTIKNAFSMPPTLPTLWFLNLIKMSATFSIDDGPACKH